MARRVAFYVILVSAAALASGIALFLTAPAVSGDSVRALVLLSFLAIIAETLALVLPNSARGSLAFIPYLASAVISPNWAALVAVAGVKLIVDSVRRVEARAAIFNIAQHALTLSAAIWTFRVLGGESLLGFLAESFLSISCR